MKDKDLVVLADYIQCSKLNKSLNIKMKMMIKR